MVPNAENDAATFARAFVDLYDAIDGVADEMSARDYRLTQEGWPLYLRAKEYLASTLPPGEGKSDG